MKVELTEHRGRQRFEVTLGGTCYVISLAEAKHLADWIYELHPISKSQVQAMREFMALLYLGIQEGRDEKFEAMDEQTKLLINEVWFDQLEEDGDVEWPTSRLHVATINKFEEVVEEIIRQMNDFLEGLMIKVRYIGASDAQVLWGNCDDPRDVLVEGEVYEVEDREAHTWHTKLSLVGVEGQFNSVCFEEVWWTTTTQRCSRE